MTVNESVYSRGICNTAKPHTVH